MIASSSRLAAIAVGSLAAAAALAVGLLAVHRSGGTITIGTSTLSWGGCPSHDSVAASGRDCSTLGVPIDRYRKGRQIAVSVTRRTEPVRSRPRHTLRTEFDLPDWDGRDVRSAVLRLLPGHTFGTGDRHASTGDRHASTGDRHAGAGDRHAGSR